MADPLAAQPGGPIEIELRSARDPAFTAIVTLRGEHDMASAPAIAEALGAIFGDVLVDLSECTFCDSSVIRVLFAAGRARRREGHRIELHVPAANSSIARIFEVTGVGSQITIHSSLEPADAIAAAPV